MGDSLDDFFAKKDKKRGKDKGKTVVTAEALVKELEEGSKQVEYTSRKENSKTSATIELLGLDTDDADWRDFEDMEKRDYTGLKIKEISLQEQNDEDLRRLQTDQAIESKEEGSAWKPKDEPSTSSSANPVGQDKELKSDTTLATNASDQQVKKDKQEEAKESDLGSGATAPAPKLTYKPPQQRMTKLFKPRPLRDDRAPDLENKSEFPGLG